MKPLRKIGTVALLLFCSIWLSLLFASYLFSKKPPACFAITTLPYPIESSGCFVLRSDLTLRDPSGTAILVRASNVRLDLDGHRITGPSDTMVSGIGIAGYGVHDVTIENGTISGFLYGIRIEKSRKRSSERIILQNVALTGNTFRGATIEGKNSLIENVRIEHTGGSHFFPDAFAIGLELGGPDCRIRKNRIGETYPVGKGEAVALSFGYDVQGCIASENELQNLRNEKSLKTFGILTRKESIPTIINNQIRGFQQNTSALCLVIPDLPFTIENPGCYELRRDLKIKNPSGSGILIRSSNVHIDLGGFRISGPAHPRGSGVGIVAEGVQNVSVQNGTISGFLYGLRANREANGKAVTQFSVRNVSFLDNGFRGIAINGANTVIENVSIENTGGSHFFPDAFAIGLELSGSNCKIRENTVRETHPVGKGESMAIALMDDTQGCLIEKNTLKNTRRAGELHTTGIWRKPGNERPQIGQNEISGFALMTN